MKTARRGQEWKFTKGAEPMRGTLVKASGATVLLLGLAWVAFADGPEAGCCPDGCGEKVCRSVVETKTVTKRVYSEVCEDFCVPRCLGCAIWGGDCDGNCCKLQTRKYLVVKQRKHEECVNKCVVEHVCPPPTCVAHSPYTSPVLGVPPSPQGAPHSMAPPMYAPMPAVK
jgi:hypothetical protein